VKVIAIPLAFRRAAVAGIWFSQSCSKSVDRSVVRSSNEGHNLVQVCADPSPIMQIVPFKIEGGAMRGLGNGAFDPQTLVLLETAFDEAWLTLKSAGNKTVKPDKLARAVLHLAIEGERDPARLHDGALEGLLPAGAWRETS
jgi:hypothetical protein